MRFITATDRSFFAGTAVLIYSIVEKGLLESPQFVVLHDALSSDEMSYLQRICSEVQFLNVRALPAIRIPTERLSGEKRGRLKKLLMFGVDDGSEFCYLDSDMLCVGGLCDVCSFDHFSVALNIGRSSFRSVRGRPMFNSGFIRYRSSSNFLNEVIEFSRSDHFAGKADQWLLNDFMYTVHAGDVHIVHSIYNAIVSTKASSPATFRTWSEDGIRILHFTNAKPWRLRRDAFFSAALWRNWHDIAAGVREYGAWYETERRMQETVGRAPNQLAP
jgi:lipopolysaccharide biosynthesis glycosyltransferase